MKPGLLLGALAMLAPAAAHGAPLVTVLLPLGGPQFFHHAPGRGAVFCGLQVVGVGGAVLARGPMLQAASEGDARAFATWKAVSYGSVSLSVGSWFVSAVDGSRLHDQETYGARLGDPGVLGAWGGSLQLLDPRVQDDRAHLPTVAGGTSLPAGLQEELGP